MSPAIAGFGGGCHWCTEAVFQQLRGVHAVRQGFIRADVPDDGWSEAVEVDFDPTVISPDDLLAVHLATHASTANHSMRGKYRSAVYVTDPAEAPGMVRAIAQLGQRHDTKFVTRALAHRGFKSSDRRFHDYYRSDPDKPFCRVYIDPKLTKLRQRFADLLQQWDET